MLMNERAPMFHDLAIYFDESYSYPPRPEVYTVAGYVSSKAQWNRFCKEWKRILNAEGLQYFHMVKFNANVKPYAGWSKVRRLRFLHSLHAVIHKRTLMGFATAVSKIDFEALSLDQRRVLRSPHVFAAQNCMKAVGFWACEKQIYRTIDYVFEQGSQHQSQLKAFIESMSEQDRQFYRIGTYTFGDKKLAPLQAADIAAYESTREIVRQRTAYNQPPPRRSGINLCRTKNVRWVHCEQEAFIKTLQDAALRARAQGINSSPGSANSSGEP